MTSVEEGSWLGMALAGAWERALDTNAPTYACVGFVADDASGIPDEVIGVGRYGSEGLAWHDAVRAFADRRPDLLPLVREMPRGNRSLCILAVKGEVIAATMEHPFKIAPREALR